MNIPCGKVAYIDEEQAIKERKRLNRGVAQEERAEIYQCPLCHYYHIGHKEENTWKKNKRKKNHYRD